MLNIKIWARYQKANKEIVIPADTNVSEFLISYAAVEFGVNNFRRKRRLEVAFNGRTVDRHAKLAELGTTKDNVLTVFAG